MELERRLKAAQERAERNRLKLSTAKHVVALWNVALAAGWRTVFYPSMGTALATGCNWLHVVCPACQQLGEVDLRTLDVHPNASIGVVIRAMSCQRCSPHPPFARPLGATRRSWYGHDGWINMTAWEPVTIQRADGSEDIGWAQRQILAAKRRRSNS
jgi:hypothetical protein